MQDNTPSNIQNEIPIVLYFVTEDREFINICEFKSKIFYTHIVKQKALKPHMEDVWLEVFGYNSIDFRSVYFKKI